MNLTPIVEQVLSSCRTNWESVENKDEITPEWWLAFCGHIPDEPNNLTDLEVLAVAIVGLQEELHSVRGTL